MQSRLGKQVGKTVVRCVVLASLPLCAQGAGFTFEIPPVQASLDVSGQPIAITVAGSISESAAGRGEGAPGFTFNLRANLRDLQDHLTPLLQSQLNQSNRCGERMSVEQASIVPAPPAAHLTVRVHFERWACLKAFGKENTKRLVGGDGTVQMTLTPVVEQGGPQGNAVRLDAQVGSIEADGSLGELLRSGSLGAALRDKIRDSILKAVQKSTDLRAVLPPLAQPFVNIRSVAFDDDPGGGLALKIAGGLLVPAQQVSSLLAQLRDRH